MPAFIDRRTALLTPAGVFAACACGARFTRAEPPAPAKGRTLDDLAPFAPPKTLAEWTRRRESLRVQLAAAMGLWPTPPRGPLNAAARVLVEEPDLVIEAVRFESRPGHAVTGNLYRPRTFKGKAPGVLVAHGHWANGRLHDAGEPAAAAMVKLGGESSVPEARWFMQALPRLLALLGMVALIYDMVGYAESTAIPHDAGPGRPHPEGFADLQAQLRLQSLFGLQTWNSVRALDYLETRPDVDPARLGVTGASGGGTQSFVLAALDERVKVCAPAVMVSTGMQGGCVCENAPVARVGTGNVELAALVAPRPLCLTGADDWTKEILTKGYPELRALYKLHGAESKVRAECWPQFPHNFNRPAREFVASFLREHLIGTPGPVTEARFSPLPPGKLRVYDAAHPRPAGELGAAELRRAMTAESEAQLAALPPGEWAAVCRAGWAALVACVPPADAAPAAEKPTVLRLGDGLPGTPGRPWALKTDPAYAGFTWGYNRTLLAERVRVTLVTLGELGPKPVNLVGEGEFGATGLVVAAIAPGRVARVAADTSGADFAKLTSADEANYLPGALKYGGLAGLLRLIGAERLKTWDGAAKRPAELEAWLAGG